MDSRTPRSRSRRSAWMARSGSAIRLDSVISNVIPSRTEGRCGATVVNLEISGEVRNLRVKWEHRLYAERDFDVLESRTP